MQYGNDKNIHLSAVIDKTEKDSIKLIESSYDGNIRVWNFYSGIQISEIKVNDYALYGICLVDEFFLCVGCDDNTIKIVDLKKRKVIDTLEGHNNYVVTIKKIVFQNNEFFISQAFEDDKLKLWKDEKKEINIFL